VIAALMMVGALTAPRLQAQSQAADTGSPAFEVASVKPNKAGDGRILFRMQPGGRFTATNVPLRELIRVAYGIQNTQLVGGPDWIGSERFDIVAKAEGDIPPSGPGGPPGPMQMMIRALLADRFKLTVHNETRELPIYSLVVARADGRLGPQLRASQVDCAAVIAAARARGGPPPAPPQPGERPTCGIFGGLGRVAAGSVPTAQLAMMLSQQAGRIVVDRTGLTGMFDFDLQWTPEQLPQRAPGTPADQPLRINGADIDPNGPSIFTAVQEQLGLKLEAQRGPVEVLVIDSVEPPTPD
jgi:uncharacterized protein (TIGR03435 family)